MFVFEFLFEFLFAGRNTLTGACGIASHCIMDGTTVLMCTTQQTQLLNHKAAKMTSTYGRLLLLGLCRMIRMTAGCMQQQLLGTQFTIR